MVVDDSKMDERDKERCMIAVDEAFGMCKDNEALFEYIAGLMGVRNDVLQSLIPLSEKYQKVLGEGVGKDEKSVSRWVIARAWDLTISEGYRIPDAFQKAWEESDIRTGKTEGTTAVGTGAAAHEDTAGDIEDFPEEGP